MFGSYQFRKVLLIRFLAYLGIMIGFVIVVAGLEPVVGEEVGYRFDQLLGLKHSLPRIVTSASQNPTQPQPTSLPSASNEEASTSFGSLISGRPQTIIPTSTDFGIVIEKIDANAKVIADVDPSNSADYTKALAQGVAHAKGTNYPGEVGNIYLFSHSTDAPWNIVRYNAIFYLLNKLDSGDRIILFYKGRRYDYIVYDKVVAGSKDTHFLTDKYNQSVLTLQTCDPPGTVINRLLIRAKLASS